MTKLAFQKNVSLPRGRAMWLVRRTPTHRSTSSATSIKKTEDRWEQSVCTGSHTLYGDYYSGDSKSVAETGTRLLCRPPARRRLPSGTPETRRHRKTEACRRLAGAAPKRGGCCASWLRLSADIIAASGWKDTQPLDSIETTLLISRQNGISTNKHTHTLSLTLSLTHAHSLSHGAQPFASSRGCCEAALCCIARGVTKVAGKFIVRAVRAGILLMPMEAAQVAAHRRDARHRPFNAAVRRCVSLV